MLAADWVTISALAAARGRWLAGLGRPPLVSRPRRPALGTELRGVHYLEVGTRDLAQRVQLVVRPALVRRAADVPVRAVVRDDHPVALERDQDDSRLAWEAADVEARLQADAQAHRRQIGVGERARVVAGRVDVRAAGVLDGEAERVVDDAALGLVVAREAGEDRQAGRVGRGPARRPELVRAQAPGRSRPGAPAAL